MKTAKGLVSYANAQLGLPYWYGTFGQKATAELYAAKKKQYPELYKSWNDFPTQYGQRVHDCVGLIKGYLWSETATATPKSCARTTCCPPSPPTSSRQCWIIRYTAARSHTVAAKR